MKPIDFDNIEALLESARAAYIEGNTILSEALDRLVNAYDQADNFPQYHFQPWYVMEYLCFSLS